MHADVAEAALAAANALNSEVNTRLKTALAELSACRGQGSVWLAKAASDERRRANAEAAREAEHQLAVKKRGDAFVRSATKHSREAAKAVDESYAKARKLAAGSSSSSSGLAESSVGRSAAPPHKPLPRHARPEPGVTDNWAPTAEERRAEGTATAERVKTWQQETEEKDKWYESP